MTTPPAKTTPPVRVSGCPHSEPAAPRTDDTRAPRTPAPAAEGAPQPRRRRAAHELPFYGY